VYEVRRLGVGVGNAGDEVMEKKMMMVKKMSTG